MYYIIFFKEHEIVNNVILYSFMFCLMTNVRQRKDHEFHNCFRYIKEADWTDGQTIFTKKLIGFEKSNQPCMTNGSKHRISLPE